MKSNFYTSFVVPFALCSTLIALAHADESKKPAAASTQANKLAPVDRATLEANLAKTAYVKQKLENEVMKGNAEIDKYSAEIERICKEYKIDRDKLAELVNLDTGDIKRPPAVSTKAPAKK